MKKVHLLHHERKLEKNLCQHEHIARKGIGIFCTQKEAEETLAKYKKMEGFRDYPDGFQIREYLIDSLYNLWIDELIEENDRQKCSLSRVYTLHYILEFEDGHEDTKLLGIFSLRKKASQALAEIRKIPSLKHLKKKNFNISKDKINLLDWREGFITDPHTKLDIAPWFISAMPKHGWRKTRKKSHLE